MNIILIAIGIIVGVFILGAILTKLLTSQLGDNVSEDFDLTPKNMNE